MKRIYILFSLFLVSIGIMSQDYYWYRGQKIFLERGDERYVLFSPDAKSGIDTSAFIKIGIASDASLRWGIQKQTAPILSDFKYFTPSYRGQIDTVWNIYVTNRFYVKLKSENDYPILLSYANEQHVNIESKSPVPQWYILSCTAQTNINALQLANLFYESGLFAASEPEFTNIFHLSCANDTYFNLQWNLHNVGQFYSTYSGMDINYCDAHNITSGNESIVIAIVDDGVDTLHEDIRPPLYSYDIPSMSSPHQIYGAHGTHCAGIIGAYTNNEKGISGIAPGCSLMAISNIFAMPTNTVNAATSIIYAADNGADVINNAWSSEIISDHIYDAIGYAIVNGRNGSGCVVVFGSGNNNGPIIYPAETHDDIIVVGAITPWGDRKSPTSLDSATYWGSNYGAGLDVVAPGKFIYTTDIMGVEGATLPTLTGDSLNYLYNEGTSTSCAQVSAIAGLILSINPDLTQKEVGDIICSTAQKVGPYSYDSIAPNGSWDYEMGYGLVDAYAAVRKAQLSMIEIDGPTYFCDSSYYYVRHAPEGSTFHWSISGEYLLGWGSGILGARNRDSVLIGRDMEPIKGGHSPVVPFPIIHDTICVLSITVTLDGVSYCKSRTIHGNAKGIPEIIASDTSTLWQRYTERTFTVTNCTEVPDNKLAWEAILTEPPFYNLTMGMARGRTFSFTPVTMGTYEIRVTNEGKLCGPNSTTNNYVVVNNAPSKAKGMVLKYQFPEDSCTNAFPQKLLRDGQLIILNNGKTYNANGVVVK